MNVDVHVTLWAVGIIFLGGAAYADMRVRVGRIEKAIGNGIPGVFLRRNEAKLMVEDATRTHARHDGRLDALESRVRDIEARQ